MTDSGKVRVKCNIFLCVPKIKDFAISMSKKPNNKKTDGNMLKGHEQPEELPLPNLGQSEFKS